MSHARSPWFAWEVLPPNIGVYERRGYEFKAFQYWDGRHWIYGDKSPIKALEWARKNPHDVCAAPDEWRGLKHKPVKETQR